MFDKQPNSCKKKRELRETSPEWYFRELHQAHRNATDTLFSHLGIKKYGQPMILFILARESEEQGKSFKPTQKELAERLGVSPSTTTISLKSLERLGCVRKVSDHNDMRCKRIELTEKGLSIAHKFHEAFHTIDTAMYDSFTEEERELISHLYRKMTANLLKFAENPETPLKGGKLCSS